MVHLRLVIHSGDAPLSGPVTGAWRNGPITAKALVIMPDGNT
jgi:hypothetical protein